MSWRSAWESMSVEVGGMRMSRLENMRLEMMRKLGEERLEDVAEYLIFLESGGQVVLPMPKGVKE